MFKTNSATRAVAAITDHFLNGEVRIFYLRAFFQLVRDVQYLPAIQRDAAYHAMVAACLTAETQPS